MKTTEHKRLLDRTYREVGFARRAVETLSDQSQDDSSLQSELGPIFCELRAAEKILEQFAVNNKNKLTKETPERIFELWLACYENTEIALLCGCDEKTVRTVIGESAELPKLRKDALAACTCDLCSEPDYQSEKAEG